MDTKKIAGKILLALTCLALGVTGVMNVLNTEASVEALNAVGYPPYFGRMLGVFKLLGVAGILQPQSRTLKEWAYACSTFLFIGATISHSLNNEPITTAIPAAIVTAIIVGSYFLNKTEVKEDK